MQVGNKKGFLGSRDWNFLTKTYAKLIEELENLEDIDAALEAERNGMIPLFQSVLGKL